MKTDFSTPIRIRADGSLYGPRRESLFDRFYTITVFLTLAALFAVVATLAIVGPFKVEAGSDGQEVMDAVGGPEFASEEPFNDSVAPEMLKTESVPSISPVDGKPTSNFGYRRNPFGRISSEFHAGQDFAAPLGTMVSATASGKVSFSGWQRGYGNIVIVHHGEGISTRYAHLSKVSVDHNQPVDRGDKVGEIGSTGRSTGPHLHYEVRLNDVPTDPSAFLPK